MTKIFLSLISISITITNALAYSSFVMEPPCWDTKLCGLENRTFDFSCPQNEKGEGYCNKKFRNRYYYYMPSHADEDEIVRFRPKIVFTGNMGSEAYRYDSTGVYYHGKKVCNVSPHFAIPYIGKEKVRPYFSADGKPRFTRSGEYKYMKDIDVRDRQEPCPIFLDGPVRYMENTQNIVAGALVTFDGIYGNRWWVEYKGEKLFFVQPDHQKDINVSGRSKSIVDKIRKQWPQFDREATHTINLLKKDGLKKMVENKKIELHTTERAERFYPKFSADDVFKWYDKSSFFRDLINRCFGRMDDFYVEMPYEDLELYFIKYAKSPVITNSSHFSIKEYKGRFPLEISCAYWLNKKKDISASLNITLPESTDSMNYYDMWAR